LNLGSALQRAGYIERVPSPEHRRILQSRLTERGLAELEACDRAVDEMEREMLVGVPENQRSALTAQLISCVQALHAGFADRADGAASSSG
jgi:DNA-binding MarR family transcriptional regulator